MNGFRQIALNLHLLAHIDKNTGKSSILANGSRFAFRDFVIIHNLLKNLPGLGPGFL